MQSLKEAIQEGLSDAKCIITTRILSNCREQGWLL